MIVTLFKTADNGSLLYYSIHDRQSGLSHPYSLTVTWSRGAGRGREKFYLFDNLEEKDRMIRTLLAKRTRDGYRLLYSFSRDSVWKEAAEKAADEVSRHRARKAR